MIRINLLAVERKPVKRAVMFQAGQKITAACTAILIVAALFVGWRYWSLQQQSVALDKDISAAQQETTRLHAVILQVQQFEQQRAQLQQRVVLIEQLRKSQTGPVHMLDQISLSLPQMLWLTQLKQDAESVLIEGRTTMQTGVSDFVANLEASGYFKKSIDIVNTQTEEMSTPPGELIRFGIRAQFQQPDAVSSAPAKPPSEGGKIKRPD
jgi:type IV pilus assembly protein PilN